MTKAAAPKAKVPARPSAAPKAMAAPAKTYAARADKGGPVDEWFAKQPPPLRAIAEELRALVEECLPGAAGALKWGMPFYTLDGTMVCAITAHKAHVNLILAGDPESFDDPGGLLEGGGKTGRHLKVRTLDELPRAAVVRWLRRLGDATPTA